MSTTTDPDAAARLKDEGNKHFEKKEFSQAYDKYTAALKKGGDNAIIYANRAACLLAQRKFLDAINDAQKATEVEPTYSKGWGRLASAYMGLYKGLSAKEAYQKAMDCLPESDLTPAQQKQKKQYEDGIREAEELARPKKAKLHTVAEENVKYMPWHQAAKMFKEMGRPPVHSSARMIGQAYQEWDDAMVKMRKVKPVKFANGQVGLSGPLDVITGLTNAVLRDRRVFHIAENNWMEMFERQALYETSFSHGWVNVGPKLVLEDAQARVKKDGWEGKPDAMGLPRGGVRQAMGSQVRVWIMQAFVLRGLKQDNLGTETLYSDTLDFLEKGRAIWANVDTEDRGTIFEETFIRGVRTLHLEAYTGATMTTRKGKYTLKNLFEVAKRMYDEALAANENKPMSLYDPSFYAYPVGQALSTMALCLRTMAQGEDDEEKKKDHYKQAGQLFHQSAQYYFEDDEYHCQVLSISLSSYWKSGAGLDVTLDIMKALKAATPKMMKIWAHSAMSKDPMRDRSIELCLNFYDEVLEKVSRGELTKDAQYLPDDAVVNSL